MVFQCSIYSTCLPLQCSIYSTCLTHDYFTHKIQNQLCLTEANVYDCDLKWIFFFIPILWNFLPATFSTELFFYHSLTVLSLWNFLQSYLCEISCLSTFSTELFFYHSLTVLSLFTFGGRCYSDDIIFAPYTFD